MCINLDEFNTWEKTAISLATFCLLLINIADAYWHKSGVTSYKQISKRNSNNKLKISEIWSKSRKIFSCVIKKGARPDILDIVTSTWEESCFDSWQGKKILSSSECPELLSFYQPSYSFFTGGLSPKLKRHLSRNDNLLLGLGLSGTYLHSPICSYVV